MEEEVPKAIEETLGSMGPMLAATLAFNVGNRLGRTVHDKEVSYHLHRMDTVEKDDETQKWSLISPSIQPLQNAKPNTSLQVPPKISSESLQSLVNALYANHERLQVREKGLVPEENPNSFQEQQFREEDAKNLLQHFWHSKYQSSSTPQYITETIGPHHQRSFVSKVPLPPLNQLKEPYLGGNVHILGFGTGITKKDAEKKAAYDACVKLRNLGLLHVPKNLSISRFTTDPTNSTNLLNFSQPQVLQKKTQPPPPKKLKNNQQIPAPAPYQLPSGSLNYYGPPMINGRPAMPTAPIMPQSPQPPNGMLPYSSLPNSYNPNWGYMQPMPTTNHVNPYVVQQQPLYTSAATSMGMFPPTSTFVGSNIQQNPNVESAQQMVKQVLQKATQQYSQGQSPSLARSSNLLFPPNTSSLISNSNLLIPSLPNNPSSPPRSSQHVGSKRDRRENYVYSNESRSKRSKNCLIVVDGQNVAVAHGRQNFSSKGISVVIDYWKQKNHPVIAFLPQYFVKNRNADRLADDVSLLNGLIDKGLLHLTPPQDHDDSYIVQYARKHDACVVTNDLFRDLIEKGDVEDREALRSWIRERSIGFIFVRDEYIPNPDFKFP